MKQALAAIAIMAATGVVQAEVSMMPQVTQITQQSEEEAEPIRFTDPANPHFEFEITDEASHTCMLRKFMCDEQAAFELGEIRIPETATFNGEAYTVTSIDIYWTNLPDFTCNNLPKLVIPKTLTDLGGDQNGALMDKKFTDIEVDEENPVFCSVDGVCFSKDMSRLIRFPAGSMCTSYTVPEGVKELSNHAFNNADKLTGLNLPTSLETIRNRSISGTALVELTIPDNVTLLYNPINEWQGPLNSNRMLERVYIGKGIKEIPMAAFALCDKLKCVTGCENVTVIGELAFMYCPIEEFTFSPGLQSIGYRAFSDSKFKIIDLSQLTELTEISSSISGELEELILPPNLKHVPDNFVSGMTNLRRFVIGECTQSMGKSVFYRCGLEEIVIPDGVEAMDNTVYGCPALKTLVLGSGLKEYIASESDSRPGPKPAFAKNCDNLTAIYVRATEPPAIISIYAPFKTEESICTLYVPKGCLEAYRSAENWKDFAHIEEMESTGIDAPVNSDVEFHAPDGIYNLQGVKLTDVDALASGIYIVVRNGRATTQYLP